MIAFGINFVHTCNNYLGRKTCDVQVQIAMVQYISDVKLQ